MAHLSAYGRATRAGERGAGEACLSVPRFQVLEVRKSPNHGRWQGRHSSKLRNLRAVNERITDMGWDEEGHALDFLCECPDPNCVETRAEYAERREQGYI